MEQEWSHFNICRRIKALEEEAESGVRLDAEEYRDFCELRKMMAEARQRLLRSHDEDEDAS